MKLFVLFLIGIRTTVSQAACPGVQMFKGTQEVTNFNCTLHSTSSCQNGPSRFPSHLRATSTDANLSEPRDFSVTTWRKNVQVQTAMYNAAGLTFKWKVPADLASRSKTKGYYLNLQRANSGRVICRLIDLTNTSLTSRADYNFELTLFPLGSDDTFLINIYSLPVPSWYQSAESSNYMIVTVYGPRNLAAGATEPAKWMTWIKITKFQGQNKIQVQFGLPDSSTPLVHFNRYQLTLVRVPRNDRDLKTGIVTIQNSTRNATSACYNFTGVSSGRYNVQLRPKDLFMQQNSRCQCWTSSQIISRICGPCTASITSDFNFTALAPSAATDTDVGDSTILLIVVVPTLSVLTMGFILALSFNFLKKDETQTQKVVPIGKSESGEEKK